MTGTGKKSSAWHRLPPAGPGQHIGLFGGSFDPPHEGHRQVCMTALNRLGLDSVWWLVTPGNPLKNWRQRTGFDARLEMVGGFVRHPRFQVTGFEAEYGLRYTAETLKFLKMRRRDLNFVWIMGADNLAGFHKWRDWRSIFEGIPIAVIDRPGAGYSHISSKVARRYRSSRVDANRAARLAYMKPPCWTFLHAPMRDISSTELREKAGRAEVAET